MLELSDWRDLMIQECIIQVAAAFVGTIAFSVLFSVARRHYLSCGLVGAIGWLIYYIFHYLTDSTVFSIFLASIGVAFVSRFSAAKYKTLTPIFLIPGLFPLVPGSGIFYTAYYLFMGNEELTAFYGFLTLKMAIAIALGIGIIYSMPARFYGWKQDSKVWFEGKHLN